MKTKSLILIMLLFVVFINTTVKAQSDTSNLITNKTYVIITYSDAEFLGNIISRDYKEIIIDTKNKGKVSIPFYEIKDIKEVKNGEYTATGDYMPEQEFASRYFITTNGFPIAKGEGYILWNLYGPDIQLGVSENVSVGFMTSWSGIPIIGSVKYSHQLSDKAHLGIGTLLGTGSWAAPDFGLAVPYAALSLGDRRSNINFSAGYGLIWAQGESHGSLLFSVAGMTRVAKKVSLVFDSFIVSNAGIEGGMAIFIPGIRIQQQSNKAFQFGFGGLLIHGELTPSPLPMIQWFRKF